MIQHRFFLHRPALHRHRPVRSRHGESPLARGILGYNVRMEEPGLVRVALWREWAGMLREIRAAGPFLQIVRNRHASLGVTAEYPLLEFSPNETMAADPHGALFLDFGFWRRAWAAHQATRGGHLYSVEVEDGPGNAFYRLCLLERKGISPFIDWTQTHQATGLEEARTETSGRPPIPAAFHLRAGPGALHLSPHLLRTALITAAQREISIEATVYTPGARQRARIEASLAAESKGWLQFSGEGRAFFVEAEPAGLLRVEPHAAEGRTSWRLRLVHPDGRLWLQIAPTADHLDEWDALVREALLGAPDIHF